MKREFLQTNIDNNISEFYYFDRLCEIALSRFKWSNLPDSMDERYIELSLLAYGNCLFFYDDILGHLSLPSNINGPANIYGIPIDRQPISANGYTFQNRTNVDSVIVYNNYTHTPTTSIIYYYAKRLFDLDRTIDVNTNAQKTPILILCDKKSELTLKNIYNQYAGNAPKIFANKENFNAENIQVINTTAPYVADKIHLLKQQLWYEALTVLGVPNLEDKKERYTNVEIENKNNDSEASIFTALISRQKACEEYNKMHNLDIWCELQNNTSEVKQNVEVYN